MNSTHVTIALNNPKNATNVGAVMRAAGCYQVDQVVYDGQRYDRAVKLNTDTKNIRSSIPLTKTDSLLRAQVEGIQVVCVDLVEGAQPLPNFKHPEKALYLFGPEDGTIPQDIIDRADHVVYVPTIGCMNLAATVNVLLYDRLAKSQQFETDNSLIRSSRDNRNNRCVRVI